MAVQAVRDLGTWDGVRTERALWAQEVQGVIREAEWGEL